MSGSLLGLGELIALAYVSVAFAISLVFALAHPALRDRLASVAPEDRARWITTLCLAPACGALLMTAACLLPSVEGLDWHLVDHCHAHDSGHPHLCIAHLPAAAGTIAGLAAVLILVLLLLTALVELLRVARLGRQLQAVVEDRSSVATIDSSHPLAATVGILRPKVLLSSALRRILPDDQVTAIEHHERAHVRRRDPLVRTVARLGCLLHFPATRRNLLRDLQLACEQACDEYAARQLGDRLIVASALLAVERLLATSRMTLPASVSGFGTSGIAARVGALTGEPVARCRAWLPATITGLLILVVAAADRIHHTTETLLGFVTR